MPKSTFGTLNIFVAVYTLDDTYEILFWVDGFFFMLLPLASKYIYK